MLRSRAPFLSRAARIVSSASLTSPAVSNPRDSRGAEDLQAFTKLENLNFHKNQHLPKTKTPHPRMHNRAEMRTQRQIEASRINGAKSRGPVTHAGRQESSRNSRRHCLYAKDIQVSPPTPIPPNSDPSAPRSPNPERDLLTHRLPRNPRHGRGNRPPAPHHPSRGDRDLTPSARIRPPGR
jgi:hypothetical protein